MNTSKTERAQSFVHNIVANNGSGLGRANVIQAFTLVAGLLFSKHAAERTTGLDLMYVLTNALENHTKE